MSRASDFSAVSRRLTQLGDREVAELVAAASPLGTGIGGETSVLRIADIPVFVKKIRLTDLEVEHPRCTANLYDIPAFLQYGVGIGSTGFNAWREVAVHEMTTDWVLSGAYEGFPLTYHWRVLPEALPMYEQLADTEKVVSFWDGAEGVRRRLTGLRDTPATAVLFCEYIPQSLETWLAADLGRCERVRRDVLDGVAFLNSQDVLHFDAHLWNLLTDGERVYFADFGLATSTRFDLSPEEQDFYEIHRTYDQAYVISYLERWLVTKIDGVDWKDHLGYPGFTSLTSLIVEFFHRFRNESRTTPYPAADIMACLA